MYSDPKLLIAAISLVVIAMIVAFVLRQMRRNKSSELPAPRPQAAGSMTMPASLNGSAKPETNGRKVIAIIHDFGHPQGYHTDERRYLSTREAFEILAEIRSVPPETPIDVVLHTPGGEAFACELIAGALKDRPNTTAYVPYCAMSAGTIIALSTEKIVMGRYACLGPIDTQFFGFPTESFTRLMREKPIQNIEDFTVLLGYLAEKEQKTARQRACELLNKHHFGRDDACQLTDFLVAGDMKHSEQIGRSRAVELGVNVTNGDCPAVVYDMVEDRLRIYKSMDEAAGLAPQYQAQPLPHSEVGQARLDDRRAAFTPPPVMWRKP